VLGHDLHGGHVKLIDIGPLFAVYFGADEPLVHLGGHRVVLKTFALHHMAPVTGAVAHREKNRLVLAARRFKRFGSPRVPVDGVVLMLQKIRRSFVGQAVGRHGVI